MNRNVNEQFYLVSHFAAVPLDTPMAKFHITYLYIRTLIAS